VAAQFAGKAGGRRARERVGRTHTDRGFPQTEGKVMNTALLAYVALRQGHHLHHLEGNQRRREVFEAERVRRRRSRR